MKYIILINLLISSLYASTTGSTSTDQQEDFVLRGIMGIGKNKKAIIYSNSLEKNKFLKLGDQLFSTKYKIAAIEKEHLILVNSAKEKFILKINFSSPVSLKKSQEASELAEKRLDKYQDELRKAAATQKAFAKTLVKNPQVTQGLNTDDDITIKTIEDAETASDDEWVFDGSYGGGSTNTTPTTTASSVQAQSTVQATPLDDDDDLVPPQPKIIDEPIETPQPKNSGPSAADILAAFKNLKNNK